MSLEQIINDILKREGGYVNHPADRGGPTKYGITLATLCSWRHNLNLKPEDVENMPEDEARAIYKRRYFEEPGFEALDPFFWPFLVDAAVNHGPSAAVKMLQRALGASPDGILGPATLTAAKAHVPRRLAAKFVAERAKKYGRIITQDPSQAAFAAGWMSRLGEFIEELV